MEILGRNNNYGGQNSNEGINAPPSPPLGAYGFRVRGAGGGGVKHVAVAVEHSHERYRRLPAGAPGRGRRAHGARAVHVFHGNDYTTNSDRCWLADANREMFPRSGLPTFSSSFSITHFPGRSSLTSAAFADTLFDGGFPFSVFFLIKRHTTNVRVARQMLIFIVHDQPSVAVVVDRHAYLFAVKKVFIQGRGKWKNSSRRETRQWNHWPLFGSAKKRVYDPPSLSSPTRSKRQVVAVRRREDDYL